MVDKVIVAQIREQDDPGVEVVGVVELLRRERRGGRGRGGGIATLLLHCGVFLAGAFLTGSGGHDGASLA